MNKTCFRVLMMKNKTLITLLLLLFSHVAIATSLNDKAIALLRGEGWWGGAVRFGQNMPFGTDSFAYNLNFDSSGNQSTPMLISNKGRWIWSDLPFRYVFRNDSLIIDSSHSRVFFGRSGASLKEAYKYVSNRFFKTSGNWPDSLLITAPQYNLWIELQSDPTQEKVMNYARRLLDNGFPPGVLMIDYNWSNNYANLDFNKQRFPDAKKMIDELHSMGFKVMLWISPFVTEKTYEFNELLTRRMLLMSNEGNENITRENAVRPLPVRWWGGENPCMDMTNPATVIWVRNKLDYLQKVYGVDGFKLDAGDASFYTSPKLLSFRKVTPNEHTLAWANFGLIYKLNEYRAMWRMGGQPLVQRLSDKDHTWYALQTLVPQTIAQQLSGYTFTCPDMVGGGNISSFTEGSVINQKLMVRSAQCHVLMPMMQFSAAPWRVLDAEHLEAIKKAVALREQYMDYIIKTMTYAASFGTPALKSLEYDYPGQGYEHVNDQFLLGDYLMIAPITTEKDNRLVVFPPGRWKYKDLVIKGPVEQIFDVPMDELLVFEKIQ